MAIYNLIGETTSKLVVTLHGGYKDIITLTNVRTGQKYENIELGDSTFKENIEIKGGTYKVTSNYLTNSGIKDLIFKINKNTPDVLAFPSGAVYWYGNGTNSTDFLYNIGKGIKTSSASYPANWGEGKGWIDTCEKPIKELTYFGAQLNTPSSSGSGSIYSRSSWINFPHGSAGYSKIFITVYNDDSGYCGKEACRVGIGSDGQAGWPNIRATIGTHEFSSTEATRSAFVGVGGVKGSTWRSLCCAIWRE